MDEDLFNMQLRKYLKQVGVTSQRAIETAVRDALAAGRLKGDEALAARILLTVEPLGLRHEIEGSIRLA